MTVLALPLVAHLLRLRLLVVAVMAVVVGVGATSGVAGPTDWDYFVWGSDVLFGDVRPLERGGIREEGDEPGGLALYANYPFVQIGPPALLIAYLLQQLPGEGLQAAQFLCQSLGFLTVVLLDRALTRRDAHRQMQVLLGGSALMVVWSSLTRFGHLDDALTLVSLAAVVLLLRRDRPILMGLLVGLAATSKPWGVVGAALLLAIPSMRCRLAAGLAAPCVILLFWGPFLLAAPSTADVGAVQVVASASSVPGLFGVEHVADAGMLRTAQLGGGTAVAAALALTGAWPFALLGAFALRLLLDPAAYPYYAAAPAMAALLVDLRLRRLAIPVVTATVTAAWLLANTLEDPSTAAMLRLVFLSGLVVLCALAGRRALLRQRAWRSRATAAAPS